MTSIARILPNWQPRSQYFLLSFSNITFNQTAQNGKTSYFLSSTPAAFKVIFRAFLPVFIMRPDWSPTVLSYSPFWCHKKVGNTASNSYMHVGDKNAITHMSHEHYGIQNHWQLDCLFDTLSWLTSEKTSTLTDFFWERNPPVGFPTQRDSNVESVFHVMTSPPWRDHESLVFSHRQQVS